MAKKGTELEVKVTSGVYLGGEPTLDYTIHLNGIAIKLSKQDFKNLVNAIEGKLGQDYSDLVKISEIINDKRNRVKELTKDLVRNFWSGSGTDDFDGFLFKKEPHEINHDDLYNLLDKHKEILGLE